MYEERRQGRQSNGTFSNDPIIGKMPPASPEAERAVLGALLLNDDNLQYVADLLSPDDFYVPAHKILYSTVRQIAQQSQRIDLITLQDALGKNNQLETIGGLSYLVALQEDIPTAGLIEQHARIIKEKSVLRELIGSASGIIANCYGQNDQGIAQVLDFAEKTIFQIAHKRTQQTFVQLDIWLKKTFKHLSDIKGQTKGITGLPSGYRCLDRLTSGFQKSDLIVLAARPSMGKTALALSLATNAAALGNTVGLFSLEMSAEQLTLRLLSIESGIAHQNIRNASISSDEWLRLTSVAGELAERKLFIDDTAVLSVMDLRTKARKLKAEHDLSLLVIDYLQLIHSVGHHENRHQEVSDISRSLKALAKELNIPIIALSQLSRAVENRMDKRPMLSDLRESGAIEQDADVIMFLYRDIVYNPDTENPSGAELIIGKQRNGPTGTVFMNFVRELTKFEESEFDASGQME
jgi:replicative DNA helicase